MNTSITNPIQDALYANGFLQQNVPNGERIKKLRPSNMTEEGLKATDKTITMRRRPDTSKSRLECAYAMSLKLS